ncbi:sulfide/dihydroorotate dehydrogenase-like FAD/NAD-binding protein [bacterium]|nr:sulfide/dihydroorotate dehydrogenase-like FAD/NAD-binding protein [bacterium]
MSKSFKQNEVIQVHELAKSITMMEVYAPNVVEFAKPGQFVIVINEAKGERIPLTIADFSKENGILTLVFQQVGKSTMALAKRKVGDVIEHINGPLGHASLIQPFGNVLMVAGGVGIAPVFPITRALKEQNHIISIVGAKSKDGLFWVDKMKKVSDELIITTDDGSLGRAGFVTEPLKEILSNQKIDRVIAIGPLIMMKNVSKITKEKNIPLIVSLNSLMVCGMGMCGACRCTVNEKSKFTCFEGPEFDGNEVNFNEVNQRLQMYRKEEKIALDYYLGGSNGR